MFSGLRKRVTYANVMMTLALVFAMSGGAYAAKHYLITSTKQISPKVLKQLKGHNGKNGLNGLNGKDGAAGAPGAQGLQGIQGLKGDPGEKGLKGDPGEKGSDGVSVTGTPIPAGASEPCGEAGGTAYTSASGTKNVCNGKEGTQGPPGPQEITVLPTGSRETGDWAIRDNTPATFSPGAEPRFEPISFAIEIKEGVHAHFIGPEEGAGQALEKLPEEEEVVNGVGTGKKRKVCTGNVHEPSAEIAGPSVPGELCVYAGFMESNTEFQDFEDPGLQIAEMAGKTGTVMAFHSTTAAAATIVAFGTWVVTGP